MGYSTLRKYAVTLDTSTAGSRTLTFLPTKASTGNTFATSSDWTPAAADFKVAKAVTGAGLGSEASIGTAPTWVNGRVVIILSGTELTCRYLTIRIENAAIVSDEILVETYGNASAQYPTVYSGGSAGNLITSGTGTDQIQLNGSGAVVAVFGIQGDVGGKVIGGGGGTITGVGAYVQDSSGAEVAQQATSTSIEGIAGAIQAVTDQFVFTVAGAVDATTLNKTGYSLSSSQTFNVTGNITGNLSGSVGSVTGNVAGSVGSVTGAVGSVTTVNDKTGYALTSGERTAIANEVEAQIIDDTDSEKVLAAITDKIAAVNPDLSGLTLSAIAIAVRDVLNSSPAANSLGAAVNAAAANAATAATQSTAGATSAATAATQSTAAATSAATAAMQATAGATSAATAAMQATTANTTLTAIKGSGWVTGDNLHQLRTDISNVSGGGGGGGTGSGTNPVDHNGGDGVTVDSAASSTDILQYLKSDSSGADGLFVSAYLASEYDASPPVRTAKGVTRTGPDGRWLAPLMLDSGTYYIVADAAGDGYQAKINTVVVP